MSWLVDEGLGDFFKKHNIFLGAPPNEVPITMRLQWQQRYLLSKSI